MLLAKISTRKTNEDSLETSFRNLKIAQPVRIRLADNIRQQPLRSLRKHAHTLRCRLNS